MRATRWSEYVANHLRGSQKELADTTGVNPATISRWLNDPHQKPSPEQVIQFARGVHESPIQALVMAGYISPDEARMEVKDIRLADLDEIVIISELLDRAKRRAAR